MGFEVECFLANTELIEMASNSILAGKTIITYFSMETRNVNNVTFLRKLSAYKKLQLRINGG